MFLGSLTLPLAMLALALALTLAVVLAGAGVQVLGPVLFLPVAPDPNYSCPQP